MTESVNTHPDEGRGHQPPFRLKFFLPGYWLSWGVLGLVGLCVTLPRPISAFIGARLGDLYYFSSKKRRHVVQINLRLCFPQLPAEERLRIARAHFRIYGQCMLDMGLVWWARPAFLARYIRVEGLEHYRAVLERGQNVILLTGHFSAMDVGGPVISRFYPQVALIKPLSNGLIDYFLGRGRTRFGSEAYLRDKGMRPIVKAIKGGRGFSYVPDEDFGPQKSVFVPFLGTESATITALSKLAALSRAAVLPTAVERISTKEGYRVVIYPALEKYPGKDLLADAKRMNSVLAEMVRKAPEQYMWTFKYFRSRPGGAPSPYD